MSILKKLAFKPVLGEWFIVQRSPYSQKTKNQRLTKEELNRFAVVDTEDLWGNPRIKNY